MTTQTAPPAIPCGDCLHAPVCSLKALVSSTEARHREERLGDGLRVVWDGFRIDCDHHLAAIPYSVTEPPRLAVVEEPEPIRAEHGGESWRTKPEPATPQESRRRGTEAMLEAKRSRLSPDLTERQAQVLDAVVRHAGDRKAAAAELACLVQSIDVALAAVNAKGKLPEDLRAKLPARFQVQREAATA